MARMIIHLQLAILVFHWVGAFLQIPVFTPFSTRLDITDRAVPVRSLLSPLPLHLPTSGKMVAQEFIPINDEYEVDQNDILTVVPPGVLDNDTVEEGVIAVLMDPASQGDVTLEADGSFTYTPMMDFVGLDEFTYQLELEGMLSDPAVVRITVVDIQPPEVSWVAPVLDGDVLVAGVESIWLKVEATDNSLLDGVLFYRWDPVLDDYVDIVFVEAAPYQYLLYTGDLHLGWNQLFARAIDGAGNASQRSSIWIYLAPRVYFPILFSSQVVSEPDLTD